MDDVKLALLELKEDSDSGALETVAVAKQRPRHRLIWAFGVVAALLIVAVGVWLVRSKGGAPEAPLVAVPLTSYPGSEDSPSFSPDGSQVAFSWNGEKQDNFDIYVKQIGVEPPFRLTNDPAPDFSPAWSPDGRFIAFGRYFPLTRIDLILVPQRGGPERVLAEINLSGKEQLLDGPFLAWTPDSKWLVFPVPEAGQRAWALYLFSVETGERRRLTNPPTDIAGDTAPSFAPDGRTLVFARESVDLYNCDLYLLQLGENYRALGDPERIALDSPYNIDAVWMPNGREMVFVSGTKTNVGLWRMMASKPATRKRLAFTDALAPAVSQQGNRLAYVARRSDTNIWRIDLNEPGRGPSVPVLFISSTQAELMPAYSPDGKRIAFISQRSGTDEIWVCDSNGSKAVQLTSLGGALAYGPRWSWDNQNIAFTLVKKGVKDDVYAISASGGVPRRLTTHPAEDKWPYWARNGKWIYFTSTRSGQDEIWKMPASGGEAVQITRNFGDVPQESPDGKYIYYTKGWPGVQSVWRIPAEGGEETKVLDSVHPDAIWDIANDGVYFFRKPDEKGHSDICLYDFATGKSRKLLTIERAVSTGIAVSPISKTILYPQIDEAGSDLMLVENFR
jgi:Tol biopolymer transport system component